MSSQLSTPNWDSVLFYIFPVFLGSVYRKLGIKSKFKEMAESQAQFGRAELEEEAELQRSHFDRIQKLCSVRDVMNMAMGGSAHENQGDPRLPISSRVHATPPTSTLLQGGQAMDKKLSDEIRHLKEIMNKIGCFQSGAKQMNRDADLRKFYEEFESFQMQIKRMLKSELTSAYEKVAEVQKERDDISEELETVKFSNEKIMRENQRQRSCYEYACRLLDEELEETRRKATEKGILADSLELELDKLRRDSLAVIVESPEAVAARQTLKIELQASLARNAFLENEIKSVLKWNADLTKEKQELEDLHHAQVKELYETVRKLEMRCCNDREIFMQDSAGMEKVITAQQAVIAELEENLRAEKMEKNEIAHTVENQVRRMKEECIESLELMGEEKYTLLQSQEKLKEKLHAMKNAKESLEKNLDKMTSEPRPRSSSSRNRKSLASSSPSKSIRRQTRDRDPKLIPSSSSTEFLTMQHTLESLQQRHEHFRTILDHVADGMMLDNPEI